jgi:hypothetical protein
VALFGLLLVVKGFHWLCADRVEFMTQTMNLTTLFHVRMVAVSLLLAAIDGYLIYYAVDVSDGRFDLPFFWRCGCRVTIAFPQLLLVAWCAGWFDRCLIKIGAKPPLHRAFARRSCVIYYLTPLFPAPFLFSFFLFPFFVYVCVWVVLARACVHAGCYYRRPIDAAALWV